ncbi:MAG: hypothetical protein P8186_13630 [Anaerolineae bacterium]
MSLSLMPVLPRVWPPADKTMLEVAHAEALDILHNQSGIEDGGEALDILHHHRPPLLPAGTVDQIEAIVAQADKALAEV